MDKTLEYYLSLPYTREIIPDPSGIWFVRIKELPGCMSQGNTPEEAMRMIEDAMHGWIEVSLEDGDQIPEPRLEEEYSGKFVMRLPKSLHRHLAEKADYESVSLNSLCAAVLAEAVGKESNSNRVSRKQNGVAELELAFDSLCRAAGINAPEGCDLESTFSIWFGYKIELIIDLYGKGNKKDAVKNLAFLEGLIHTHAEKSPFFVCIAKMISHIGDLLEENHKEEEAGKEVYEIKNDINKVLLTSYLNFVRTNSPAESSLRFVKKEIDTREYAVNDVIDNIYHRVSDLSERDKRNISSHIFSNLRDVDYIKLSKALTGLKNEKSEENNAKR